MTIYFIILHVVICLLSLLAFFFYKRNQDNLAYLKKEFEILVEKTGHLPAGTLPAAFDTDEAQSAKKQSKNMVKEINAFKKQLNGLIHEMSRLRNIVNGQNTATGQLESFNTEYKSGHEQITTALENMLETVHSIVDRSLQQAEKAKNGVISVDRVLTILDESVAKEDSQIQSVSILTDISMHLSEMIRNCNVYINEMKEVQSQVHFSVDKMLTMNEHSKQINSILQIIEDIASQIKLLSLNAAIEASRAGESGRGFKVVADEVKNLSEKTNESINNISEQIKNIQQLIIQSNETMSNSKNKLDMQVLNLNKAVTDISKLSEQLISTMNTVKQTAEENIKNIFKMQNGTNQMSVIIKDSSNKAEENSLAIEQISSTISEITKQFLEINKKTRDISDTISMLKGSA